MSPDETREGPWHPDWGYHRPLWGIVLSMLAIIVWLVFIVLYALDWSTRYSFFQNIVVTIATLVITGLVIGIGWVILAYRYARERKKPE